MGRRLLNVLPRRAAARVFGAILAVNLPLLALLFVAVTALIGAHLEAEFENTARSHARLLKTLFERQAPAQIQAFLDELTLGGEVAYAAHIAADGAVIESAGAVPAGYVFRETFGYGEGGDGIYGISVPLDTGPDGHKALLRLGYDETSTAEAVARIYTWGLYAAAAYILALIPVSLLATGRLVAPLRRLGQTAREIAGGQTGRALALRFGVDELDTLVEDIEYMRAQLERRGAEIAEREAYHRAVLENTAEGVLTLDTQGCIESLNAAALALFGYPADQVRGTPFTRFLVSADAERFATSDGRPRAGTGLAFTAVQRGGERFPVLVSVSPFRAAGGERHALVVQDISERVQFEQELSRLAYYDPLTGLPNRRLFLDRLGQALAQADRHEKLVALLFLDLDGFKQINDALGHMVGDLLLQAVARRLGSLVRRGDTIARLGGDEFTLVLADLNHIDDAVTVAEKMIEELRAPFHLGVHETFVSTSVGITIYPFDDSDLDSLVRNADTAMYRAKAAGKGRYAFYEKTMHAAATETLAIETGLRRAVGHGELELHYQPQLEVHYQPQVERFDGHIVAAEALLRWHHPELGLLYPDRFIPVAEDTGLIVPVGEWVLKNACRQHLDWRAAGLPPLRVAVNLSARQLREPNLVARVAAVLEETGVDPAWIEIELTERMILHDTAEVATRLRELKAMGLLISIDDFGTGHSSLANLRHLPIDEIKIDRSFVHNICTDAQNAAIVSAVIEMAHTLGLRVVAEGVELEEQLVHLHQKGCDIMQGYYFSRPVPAAEVQTLLAEEVAAQDPLRGLRGKA